MNLHQPASGPHPAPWDTSTGPLWQGYTAPDLTPAPGEWMPPTTNPVPKLPPSGSAISSGSFRLLQPEKIPCSRCPEGRLPLADYRTWVRHMEECHKVDVEQNPVVGFTCCCGREIARKSNLTRHFKSCKNPAGGDAYHCRCGLAFSDFGVFQAHLKDCGRKKPGRPPNCCR
ncbi:hypothetical protein GQ53DRAFT_327616 [Thozetella sp. PMI_491]|nr:hypothetical protein GQ53DRAFT_327616 [Thozetella sp. PMI_491]